MRRALARKPGWSSTIRTVFPIGAIVAHGPAQIHTADRTVPAVTRTHRRLPAHLVWMARGREAGVMLKLNSNGTQPATSHAAVALRDVRKVHGQGDGAVVALDGISIDLAPGSFTAIMGPSGSGKSTFLHVAAGLDRPTSGSVALGETELAGLSERKLTILRRERIGFVFQAFNLMPSLTVAQNIGLALRLDGRRPRRAEGRDAAARVGLADRLRHRPAQLSGGQQQRVAIARALIARPEIVFADQPTGALDSRNGRAVLELLRSLVDTDGRTVVMVTHDPKAASYADRVIFLTDGRIAETLEGATADEVAEQLAHLGD